MKLMTKELEAKIPALYAQDGKGDKAIAHVKLFTTWADWQWYITEYDPVTKECFGLVKGTNTELGYFSLTELESLKGGCTVERDRNYDSETLKEVRNRIC